jgi:predicted nucleotidyltransferase component of viral defense system
MSRDAEARKVLATLKSLSKSSVGNSMNELRMIVALERAIARIENHPRLSSHLVFKGGFVLLKITETDRFTRDVDALALDISRKEVPKLIGSALSVDLDDGLWFGEVVTEDLTDQGPYGGYRFTCAFHIGNPPSLSKATLKKLSRIHIDVGFGDPVETLPKKQKMTSILSQSHPVSWSVYPFEYIFAEKLEALFSRGSANSRAKDIYDLSFIFEKCTNKKVLLKAIEKTFSNRKTPMPESFAQTATDYDLSVMRRAWLSVEFMTSTGSFDTAWESVIESLRELDSIRRGTGRFLGRSEIPIAVGSVKP